MVVFILEGWVSYKIFGILLVFVRWFFFLLSLREVFVFVMRVWVLLLVRIGGGVGCGFDGVGVVGSVVIGVFLVVKLFVLVG